MNITSTNTSNEDVHDHSSCKLVVENNSSKKSSSSKCVGFKTVQIRQYFIEILEEDDDEIPNDEIMSLNTILEEDEEGEKKMMNHEQQATFHNHDDHSCSFNVLTTKPIALTTGGGSPSSSSRRGTTKTPPPPDPQIGLGWDFIELINNMSIDEFEYIRNGYRRTESELILSIEERQQIAKELKKMKMDVKRQRERHSFWKECKKKIVRFSQFKKNKRKKDC